MGYYSDVAIKCEKNTYDELVKVMDENSLVPDKKQQDTQGYYYISFKGIKWYTEFEDIKSVENTLNDIQRNHETEDGWRFVFARIGEDMEDNEYINNDDYELEFWIDRIFTYPDEKELKDLD